MTDTDIKPLSYVEAAMLLMTHYADILGSAEVLEVASAKHGKEIIESILLELADINTTSRKEIKQIKASLGLAHLNTEKTNIKEIN